MQDVTDLLAGLAATPSRGAADSEVAVDVDRANRARRARHRHRIQGVGLAAAAALLAAGIGHGLSATGSANRARPRASIVQHVPAAVATTRPVTESITLTRYRGAPRSGFALRYVPDGWVVRQAGGERLTVADDRSSPTERDGSIVVSLAGRGARPTGVLVGVHGTYGWYEAGPSGHARLRFLDHGRMVVVERSRDVRLGLPDLIRFADGVTVAARD